MSSELYVENPVLFATAMAVGAGAALPERAARLAAATSGSGALCWLLAFGLFGAPNLWAWPTAREQGFARRVAGYTLVLVLPAQAFAGWRLRGLPGLALVDGCFWAAAAGSALVLLDALRLALRGR